MKPEGKGVMEVCELHIRNMVCERCIRVVREELEGIGARIISIELGRAVIGLPAPATTLIRHTLQHSGFALLSDREELIVESIKLLIIERLRRADHEENRRKNSDFLVDSTGYTYDYLSRLFSRLEEMTLEKYIILQKLEIAKEYLSYGEMTLDDIAFHLGYSSLAHLSRQFKRYTGMTLSEFRTGKGAARRPLDTVGAHVHT